MALILFIIELRLPNLCPIQGVKLGLANIVTVYAVYNFKISETAMLLFARIFLGSLFSGNISSIFYSISGGILCFIGMIILKNIVPEKYMFISSIIGAILHNTGQILMAMLLMKTVSVIAYYPILLFSGCIAGLFTGIIAQIIVSKEKILR